MILPKILQIPSDDLKSYLLDRKIITKINNTLSSSRYIRYGVTKGSVLIRLLFYYFYK